MLRKLASMFSKGEAKEREYEVKAVRYRRYDGSELVLGRVEFKSGPLEGMMLPFTVRQDGSWRDILEHDPPSILNSTPDIIKKIINVWDALPVIDEQKRRWADSTVTANEIDL